MLQSGIATLDERLGGLVEGRTYVLSGSPGTGKSVAAMEFASAGLEAGQRAVILTHDDPSDILAQAEFLGIDLAKALEDERLILLRYQLDFARRFMRASTPDLAFEELTRLMGTGRPERIVIDSVAPFLEASSASGGGVQALTRFLDELKATAFVTYPGDLTAVYDRRLEPLLQRAAAILHFNVDRDRNNTIEIRKVRHEVKSTAPISFRIQAGSGIVPVASGRRRAQDMNEDTKRHILVMNLSKSFPDELLAVLGKRFDVAVRTDVTRAFAELSAANPGLILIDVRRDTLEDALALVRQLRQIQSRAPIVLVTSFQLRSTDRARALRAGADDFVGADTHPEVVLHQIETSLRRGHTALEEEHEEHEVPIVAQRGADGAVEPFDEPTFINAVRTHIEKDRVPFFTLVTLRPTAGSPRRLAGIAVKSMRVDGGDLSGIADDEVMVYLHSIRRKDVTPFVERVREEWRKAGHGEIDVEVASYPSDENRIRSLVDTATAEA